MEPPWSPHAAPRQPPGSPQASRPRVLRPSSALARRGLGQQRPKGDTPHTKKYFKADPPLDGISFFLASFCCRFYALRREELANNPCGSYMRSLKKLIGSEEGRGEDGGSEKGRKPGRKVSW